MRTVPVSFPIVLLGLWLATGIAYSQQDSSGADSQESPNRGRITGTVVSAVTGEPIAGAYVGVGDFGDSGNHQRHREMGLYASAESDKVGRFVLDGLAARDDHPFFVTHTDYVRHDQVVSVRENDLVPDVNVALRPAATIKATVVDSEGNPVEDIFLLRLEALDGRIFFHAGRDPHQSSFASSVWIEGFGQGEIHRDFSFTELDAGDYSIDVIQFSIPKDWKPVPGNAAPPFDSSSTTYHGGIAHVWVENGEKKEVQVKPADYGTEVTLRIPKDPHEIGFPPFVLVSRKLGLLLWDDGEPHGLEDERLGRLVKNALFYGLAPGEGEFTINNLPPGTYSIFAGPLIFLKGAKVDLAQGDKITVELPKIAPTDLNKKFRSFHYYRLNARVSLDKEKYTVEELCQFLTEKMDSRTQFKADSSIRGEELTLSPGERSIFDLLESIYLEKGWRVKSEGRATLVILPSPSVL